MTGDELKALQAQAHLEEEVFHLRGIIRDLAEDDPVASGRYGPYCRYCGLVYGLIDLSRHQPGCVWQRARDSHAHPSHALPPIGN